MKLKEERLISFTTKAIISLAYELHGFSKRHPNIYFRKTEVTFTALVMDFNKDVLKFF
jgi:hypothetical protein